jgi:VWFA-related protein
MSSLPWRAAEGTSARKCAVILLAALLTVPSTTTRTQQRTFRSQVDLIRLDVTVVTGDGTPVSDLRADDFDVEIAGRTRPVRTLQFLDRRTTDRRAAEAAPSTSAKPTPTFWSNSDERDGRLFIIAVDTLTLPSGREKSLLESVARFAARIHAPDRVALLVLPGAGAPGRHVDFTTDGRAVQQVLSRTWADNPVMPPLGMNYGAQEGFNATVENRASAEALAFNEDLSPLKRNPDQEERPRPASVNRTSRLDSYDLMGLPDALTRIDGPKTLIFVAGDLPADYGGIKLFADAAVKARLSVYALRPFVAPGAPASASSLTRSSAYAMKAMRAHRQRRSSSPP